MQRGIISANDCSDLQNDLQLVYSWAKKVNMRFNSYKFECIRYWADPASNPSFNYLAPDGQQIEIKSNLRDLGVQLSSPLSSNVHIGLSEVHATSGANLGRPLFLVIHLFLLFLFLSPPLLKSQKGLS